MLFNNGITSAISVEDGIMEMAKHSITINITKMDRPERSILLRSNLSNLVDGIYDGFCYRKEFIHKYIKFFPTNSKRAILIEYNSTRKLMTIFDYSNS